MSPTSTMLPVSQLPEEVDWRTRGVISDVHNQGACGSCWAFATVAQIESYTALAGHGLVDLSVEPVLPILSHVEVLEDVLAAWSSWDTIMSSCLVPLLTKVILMSVELD